MKYEMKGNYFDGKFNLPPTSGPSATEKFITRESPADLDNILWRMPVDYRHIEPIIDSANNGFNFWRKLSVEERIVFLRRFQEQVLSRKEQIAEAIALEMGKPLWESTGEANAVVGKVNVTIDDSLKRIQSKVYEDILPGTKGHLNFKPIGPCLVIGPFNFPCHLANTQILGSLLAGNSIIFKPSEKVAYSGQLLIECFHEAGFPKGVINLIQGDGEIASRLTKEKTIKGIYFTGSKEVGQKILSVTHQDLTKLVSLELGGKNPAILFDDCNKELAMEELIKGSFLTSGQRCTSTSIVLIHDSLKDEFIDKFHQYGKKVIVDHPIEFDKEPLMGPLVDQRAVDNYLLFMGMAKREGITEVMRGKQITKSKRGHYVSPSIHFSETFDKNSHFLTSEIFGPNCTFIPFKEAEEAIEMANSTEYGLASCVFTKNRSLFDLCIRDLDFGYLNLNRSTCGASPKLPFGGVKNSGNYHPAAVASIDSCVYQMASLEVNEDEPAGMNTIKGLDLD